MQQRREASKKGKTARPPQARGLKTRELLILTAIDAMVQSNVYGLRFSQISKMANVPQPLMDYHFPSLDSLLTEMIQHQLEKLKIASLEAIQDHALKPRKALEGYIRAPFLVAEGDPGFRAVWSCYYHLAGVNKVFADFNRGVRRMGLERITTLVIAILQTEKKTKYLNKPKLIEGAATSIQGIITGFNFMVGAESDGQFRNMADLAVKASSQILASNFP